MGLTTVQLLISLVLQPRFKRSHNHKGNRELNNFLGRNRLKEIHNNFFLLFQRPRYLLMSVMRSLRVIFPPLLSHVYACARESCARAKRNCNVKIGVLSGGEVERERGKNVPVGKKLYMKEIHTIISILFHVILFSDILSAPTQMQQ